MHAPAGGGLGGGARRGGSGAETVEMVVAPYWVTASSSSPRVDTLPPFSQLLRRPSQRHPVPAAIRARVPGAGGGGDALSGKRDEGGARGARGGERRLPPVPPSQPFRTIQINWEPEGHAPRGIYDVGDSRRGGLSAALWDSPATSHNLAAVRRVAPGPPSLVGRLRCVLRITQGFMRPPGRRPGGRPRSARRVRMPHRGAARRVRMPHRGAAPPRSPPPLPAPPLAAMSVLLL